MATSKKKLELVSEGETSKVVSMFLGLPSTGRVHLSKTLKNIHPLASFLKKWDCPAAISSLLAQIQVGILTRTVSPVYAFIIAAELDDEETARIALRKPDWTWTAGDAAKKRTLDTRGWPLSLWRSAMQTGNSGFFFALSRAYDEVIAHPAHPAHPAPVAHGKDSSASKPLNLPGAFSKHLALVRNGTAC